MKSFGVLFVAVTTLYLEKEGIAFLFAKVVNLLKI